MSKITNKGFTFVEAILTLTLLTGGMLGVLHIFYQNTDAAAEMEQTLKATYLAQEKAEQMIQDKKYQGYDYIVAANYPATEDLTAEGYAGYTRTISMVEVMANDINTPSKPNPGSDYKRVTVSVAVAGGDTVTLTTLVTRWGEE